MQLSGTQAAFAWCCPPPCSWMAPSGSSPKGSSRPSRAATSSGGLTSSGNCLKNKPGMHHYNDVFVQQQIGEIDDILAPGMQILRAPGNAKSATVRKIVIPPGASRTVFLLFDRPNRGRYPPAWRSASTSCSSTTAAKPCLAACRAGSSLPGPRCTTPGETRSTGIAADHYQQGERCQSEGWLSGIAG